MTDGKADPTPARARWQDVLERFRRPVVALAGVGAVLGGLMGFWNVYKEFFRPRPAAVTANQPAREIPAMSLIVLPFTTLGGDAGQSDFADGLTTALTSDIARVAKLLVIAPPTAMSYKGRSLTARQVGAEVGVRYVLSGSIQRNGEQLRITAQLADGSTDAQLWSDSFDGKLSNLFALQDQVTGRIANSIGRELVVASARESQSRTGSPTVVDLLMRALASIYRPQSLPGLQQQEVLFRQVLALDPDNVEALAQLARALVQQGFNFNAELGQAEASRRMDEGREIGLKIRRLDPGHPGGWFAIGVHAFWLRDIPSAVQAFRETIALDARSVIAHIALSGALTAAGHPEEAIEPAQQALLLDPRGPQVSAAMTNLGRAYLFGKQPQLAVEWLNKAKLSNPAFWALDADLAVAYVRLGDDARARQLAQGLMASKPDFRLSTRAFSPTQSSPPAYVKLYNEVYLPAARKAGLQP